MKREISIRETAGKRLQHSLAKLFAQRFCLDCGRRGAGETFIEIADAPPQLKDVAGTNCCRLFPQVDERSGRLLVFSAIDNLMKGAAGQAVQNMNVMLGLPEQEGLV